MRQRRAILVGFAVALFFGVSVYARLWAIDRREDDASSSVENLDSLRRQFERANLEAMDESAEWRMKYDEEVERNRQIQDELLKVKTSLSGAIRRSETLQKEKVSLQKQIESMKQQKLHCNCNQSTTELR
ncbi:uncharacterized protein LOC121976746 [Zingiber officinale]|uniref:Uncharacterized protein n=1 Tax=Zingiber officinale TaxID=94328 RepID=A0A8J5H037_ZINOF|nr:uncharacterized protein LOC121973613 [Zingiber officinale]XP_042384989.1 uncharacterized protein LOC121976746 [Zingiber officinale]KAG6512499.1 hypothetical protein ZIOFF_030620 [Zingiber officinale]KAG6515311.1 hypothetical protein ZIOFF_025703 [Zingiber officinale]